MKILLFNWRDIRNPTAGGAERYTHNVLKKLVEMGHEATMFTSTFDGCAKREVIDGVKIFRSGGRFTVYIKAKKYFIEKFKGKFDIIIDEINTQPFMAKEFTDVPVIGLLHQLTREFWFYGMRFPLNYIGYYFLEPYCLRKINRIPIITVSQSTKESLIKYGFDEGKIFVVPGAPDAKPLPKVPERDTNYLKLIHIGRIEPTKRVGDVIKAFKYVKKEVPNSSLTIIGRGSELHKLKSKYSLEGSIIFTGYINEKEKHKLLSKSNIFITSGIREGLPLVLLERKCFALPAVGYDVPGIRDGIENGYDGLLTKEDSISLGKAVLKLWDNPNLLEFMSKNSLKIAKNYSWDKTTKKIEKILMEVYNGDIR